MFREYLNRNQCLIGSLGHGIIFNFYRTYIKIRRLINDRSSFNKMKHLELFYGIFLKQFVHNFSPKTNQKVKMKECKGICGEKISSNRNKKFIETTKDSNSTHSLFPKCSRLIKKLNFLKERRFFFFRTNFHLNKDKYFLKREKGVLLISSQKVLRSLWQNF